MNNHKIKVAFISHSSEIGGAERSLIELISGLSKRGILCHVIIPAEGSLSFEISKLSIPFSIVYLPWCAEGNGGYDKRRVGEIGLSTIELINTLKKIDVDIIYTNSSVILQGALAAKSLGKKHIWHIREFGESDYGINFFLPLKRRAKFVYEYSDKIIFISSALKGYYEKYIPENKGILIHNNVKAPVLSLDKAVKFEDDKFNLLMIGNVHPGKGQLEAIKAVKNLKESGFANINLNIVGRRQEQYYEEILKYISDNHLSKEVHFFDFANNPANFYVQADVVLMCSKSEGFGRVTVEAMLFEKPVVGSNSGGTLDIIKDGENGLLYESGDEKDLAKKILFLFNNKERALELGKKGRIYCENNFSDKKYIDGIKNIIEQVFLEERDLYGDLLSVLFESGEERITLKKDLEQLQFLLNSAKEKLKLSELETVRFKSDLDSIFMSREWKIAVMLQVIFKKLFPVKSKRRLVFEKSWFLLKKI